LFFEKGLNYSVEIMHEIDGFLISYQTIGFDDLELEGTDVRLLLERIRKVSEELNVKPSALIVETIPDGLGSASCCVDKDRVVHLILPVNMINGKTVVSDRGIHENYLLYHELMHAKMLLEGRIYSSGKIDIIDNFRLYLEGFLCDFSVEGRLEKNGKPHYSKEESTENVYQCILEDCEIGIIPEENMKMLARDTISQLCDKVWGRDLTSSQICTIIKELFA
jgi:hypothetical protein